MQKSQQVKRCMGELVVTSSPLFNRRPATSDRPGPKVACGVSPCKIPRYVSGYLGKYLVVSNLVDCPGSSGRYRYIETYAVTKHCLILLRKKRLKCLIVRGLSVLLDPIFKNCCTVSQDDHPFSNRAHSWSSTATSELPPLAVTPPARGPSTG